MVQALLPKLFGDRGEPGALKPDDLDFALHERLVKIAYRTIRVQEDIQHPPGEAYSPGDRDNAEASREWIFSSLIQRPGLATFEAIRGLTREPGFPIPEPRLRRMSEDRAATDADDAPWPAGDVPLFETAYTAIPRTPLDLQRLAQGRIEDMQHDLLHSDFAQARSWLASRTRPTCRTGLPTA